MEQGFATLSHPSREPIHWRVFIDNVGPIHNTYSYIRWDRRLYTWRCCVFITIKLGRMDRRRWWQWRPPNVGNTITAYMIHVAYNLKKLSKHGPMFCLKGEQTGTYITLIEFWNLGGGMQMVSKTGTHYRRMTVISRANTKIDPMMPSPQ